MSKQVTVVDYGLGNLFSVRRAFESQGAEVRFASNPDEILQSERLVLPGVGAFNNGMNGLISLELVEPLKQYAAQGKPFLGICLGMQMMFERSLEFGRFEGLAIIKGEVRKIMNQDSNGRTLKIPHIGWNSLLPNDDGRTWENSILSGLDRGTSAYFLHSYSAFVLNPSEVMSYAVYGGHKIVAAVGIGKVYGCQFHPERSGPAGLKMINNFLSL
ncbi:MAG: imidazole glycerol phosphate synthase subunit HisH [Bdellovibrionales bacterium]|nr:imidazole glycerol phosphate synthase subunit HisH [Bdellovibrionales bacterium]